MNFILQELSVLSTLQLTSSKIYPSFLLHNLMLNQHCICQGLSLMCLKNLQSFINTQQQLQGSIDFCSVYPLGVPFSKEGGVLRICIICINHGHSYKKLNLSSFKNCYLGVRVHRRQCNVYSFQPGAHLWNSKAFFPP